VATIVASRPEVLVSRGRRMRILSLCGAYAWSALLVAGAFLYHFPGRRSIWEEIDTSGHPPRYIYGTSPARTLFEHDAAGAVIILFALAIALTLVTLSLVLDLRFHRVELRVVAAVASGAIALFALFGLLWGIVAFWPVAALLLLASGLISHTKE